MVKKTKRILFIGGSYNQTRMGHEIARHLQEDYECYFTPFFADGIYDWLVRRGILDFTILGGRFREQTDAYLAKHGLPVDFRGERHDYDLYITGSDLLVPRKLRNQKLILVQEGMTDPENFMYHLVRWFRLPRYLASTSTNGLSDQYTLFCVASDGYRDHFIRKGVKPEKIIVTGIPNFDNVSRYLDNDFPHEGYVLVATSDARETFKIDRRKRFIRRAVEIANGRQLIFKLHPNEKFSRAKREIREIVPDALIFTDGDLESMIANCDVLITQYSTVVYIGIILGKEVHSYFDVDELRRLAPIQNGGASAKKIAAVCRSLLEGEPDLLPEELAYAAD